MFETLDRSAAEDDLGAVLHGVAEEFGSLDIDPGTETKQTAGDLTVKSKYAADFLGVQRAHPHENRRRPEFPPFRLGWAERET